MLEEQKTKQGTVYYTLAGVTVGVKCSKCGKDLPADKFYLNPSSQAGRWNVCISCTKDKKKKNNEEVDKKEPATTENNKNNNAETNKETVSLYERNRPFKKDSYTVNEVADAFKVFHVDLFKYLRRIGWCYDKSPTLAGIELKYVKAGGFIDLGNKGNGYRQLRITKLGINKLFELSSNDCAKLGVSLENIYSELGIEK